jgi:dCTP deaminase
MKTKPDVAYSEENGNKYNDQTGPTPSRLYEDFR